jgi:hypothetical protein
VCGGGRRRGTLFIVAAVLARRKGEEVRGRREVASDWGRRIRRWVEGTARPSARAFGVAARSRREGGGRLVPRPPARRLGLVSTFRERLRRIWAVRLVPSWVLDLGFRDGWRDSAGFTGGCRNLQKAEGRGDHAPARAYVGPAFFLLFTFLAGGAVHSLPVLKLSSSDHK